MQLGERQLRDGVTMYRSYHDGLIYVGPVDKVKTALKTRQRVSGVWVYQRESYARKRWEEICLSMAH